MNKKLILASLILVFGAASSHAAGTFRGPKGKKQINDSASAVLACPGVGVVYSVVIGTGAVTDFLVLRDSATANTTSNPTITVAPRTATETQVTFDPPIIFTNGISMNQPATLKHGLVTFSCGRSE